MSSTPFWPQGEKIDSLVELAFDLQWAWNHSSDEIWGKIDPQLWSLTQNPWVVLQTASQTRLRELAVDPDFQNRLQTVLAYRRNIYESPTWFGGTHAKSGLTSVAYFSMEYALSEALPIYSGGLGNVAGDQLKSASDLGVPVIGIGLLYQRGYFRQVLDEQGGQHALYPYNDPTQLPIMPVRNDAGEWVRVRVPFAGSFLQLRAWQARVGRVKLYLLDSNDPANPPAERGVTSELYGGGQELRLQQEIALGIGGWRLIEQLGMRPEVCHLNEGHAAFAVLERAASFRARTGQPFDISLTATRAGNLFTTHTPVPAGFDSFPPDLIRRYLDQYAQQSLGIPIEQLLPLGQFESDQFNMAYLAIRGSGAINGVSKLHGEVSRAIFRPLFARWPKSEIPVKHVTNGVHVATWDAVHSDTLWTKVCGRGRWRGTQENLTEKFRLATDEQIWEMRGSMRAQFVRNVRNRLVPQFQSMGVGSAAEDMVKAILDPNSLTLGFARRFATYKRPNLLLHDPDRLARILLNPNRPVQLVVAGKAHPNDQWGQAMIRDWIRFVRRPEIRSHVVFLCDYDLDLAAILVQGVDVWINTPRRPWEACGTSGMKVLVNGALNLSELDGWWAEAYSPEVGWAIGDGAEHDGSWDTREAEQLYRILEDEIVPSFYDRDWSGIPAQWVAKVRESMARLTPQFSANRSVREYTESYYLPAAESYLRRAAGNGAHAEQIAGWRKLLSEKWHEIRFAKIDVESNDATHHFRLHVYLDDIPSDAVRVELFADGENDSPPLVIPMTSCKGLPGVTGGYCYQADVSADRPATHFTPRVVPHHPDVPVPLEDSHILWA
ncbi:MAG: alpha-glucan family phosphorylase [Acidobacteria bacterium]|nr:alpha-glucan family phosphorylase [Acidobacteriota bacterium]